LRVKIPLLVALNKEELVMNTKNIFVGKSVFVGIDVHKTTYSVCIVCESEIVGKAAMPADAQVLLRYLKRFEGACLVPLKPVLMLAWGATWAQANPLWSHFLDSAHS
jgi:hypothetical protein